AERNHAIRRPEGMVRRGADAVAGFGEDVEYRLLRLLPEPAADGGTPALRITQVEASEFGRRPGLGHLTDGARIAVGVQNWRVSREAIHVVPHTAGRDDAALVRVSGADAADAEAIAPVDVGHGQAGVLDARQKGHIGYLFRCLVLLELCQQAL